jgi:voltage-dependent calcium channel T type alpha-1H
MLFNFNKKKKALDETLDIFNFVFTFIFLIEAIVRIVALGFKRYFKERYTF